MSGYGLMHRYGANRSGWLKVDTLRETRVGEANEGSPLSRTVFCDSVFFGGLFSGFHLSV